MVTKDDWERKALIQARSRLIDFIAQRYPVVRVVDDYPGTSTITEKLGFRREQGSSASRGIQ